MLLIYVNVIFSLLEQKYFKVDACLIYFWALGKGKNSSAGWFWLGSIENRKK